MSVTIENKLIDVTFLGNIFIFNKNLYDSSKKFFLLNIQFLIHEKIPTANIDCKVLKNVSRGA